MITSFDDISYTDHLTTHFPSHKAKVTFLLGDKFYVGISKYIISTASKALLNPYNNIHNFHFLSIMCF